MRDFDDYLDRLRAALDVTPKRAEEICREVRSHLDARAGELMAKGLGEQEAAAEAVAEFGAPRQMAVQLTQANDRHRHANLFGALLGFVLVSSFMVLGAIFWDAPSSFRNGVAVFRNTRAIHLLAAHTPLSLTEAKSLFGILVVLPAAVLAGMLAGRRRWWVAGIPPLLLSGVLYLLAFLGTRNVSPPVNLHLIDAVRRALIVVPVMAGCGYLGSRALGRGMVWRWVAVICGGYVIVTGLGALQTLTRASLGGPGHPSFVIWIPIAMAELSVLLLGAAAYREGRITRWMLLRLGSVVLLSGASAMLVQIAAPSAADGVSFVVAVVVLLIAGLAVLRFRRTQEMPPPAAPPSAGNRPAIS